MYGDMLQWLGGLVMLELDSGVLHEDLYGILLFGAVLVSITLLLTVSINTRRGDEFKRDSIIYLLLGVIISILTILYWIFEFDPAFETIGFTTIGIFISGIITIIAFVLDSFKKVRNEKSQ
jgi:4-amino-4-deoxy-L-arabinose transferase-like glycosyltransferase